MTPEFLAAVVPVAIIAGLAIRRARGTWGRLAAVGLFAVFLGAGFHSVGDLLGRPKPVRLEFMADVPEARIVAARIREGLAIWLWLDVPGRIAPMAYELPWSLETAKQLQDAIRDAEKGNGTDTMMRYPFEPSWESREPRFYARPQPKLPDKPMPPPPAFEYRHPEASA